MNDTETLDLLDHYTKYGWLIFKVAEEHPWIIDGNFGSVNAPTVREAVEKAMVKQAEWATTKHCGELKTPDTNKCPKCSRWSGI